jgi:hypothetical protein
MRRTWTMFEYRSILTSIAPADANTSVNATVAAELRPVCFTCGETSVGITSLTCPFCGSTDLSALQPDVVDDVLSGVGSD